MTHHDEPTFPIKVVFLEDGEEWIHENEQELANNLEWFNSEDPEDQALVTDKQGRAVTLVIEALQIKQLELR